MQKLKLMTIVGTRPEVIRLSEVIKKCDRYFDHYLVHTGQNYDYELNQIFFEDLDLRRPIYRKLAAYGHMGREDLGVKWENTDRVEELKAAVAAL